MIFLYFCSAMKRIQQTAVTLALLAVLLFGGGVGLSRCLCTGQTRLLLPTNGKCCIPHSSCMEVTVVTLSPADETCSLTLPVDSTTLLPSSFECLASQPTPSHVVFPSAARRSSPPGDRLRWCCVMRV